MPSITKPVMLDETGQLMVSSLAQIAASMQKGTSRVYIVNGATAFSSGWLSQYNGGTALTPSEDVLYVVASSGDYHNHIYVFNNSTGVYEPLISTIEIPNASASRNGLMSSTDYSFVQQLKDTTMIYEDQATMVAGAIYVQFTDSTITDNSIIEVFTNTGAQYTSIDVTGNTLTVNFDEQETDTIVKVRWS